MSFDNVWNTNDLIKKAGVFLDEFNILKPLLDFTNDLYLFIYLFVLFTQGSLFSE